MSPESDRVTPVGDEGDEATHAADLTMHAHFLEASTAQGLPTVTLG